MDVLLEGSPSSTEKLLVTSLTKAHLAQFGQAASSKKSLGGSNLFHLRVMEATVFLGTFNAAEMFW